MKVNGINNVLCTMKMDIGVGCRRSRFRGHTRAVILLCTCICVTLNMCYIAKQKVFSSSTKSYNTLGVLSVKDVLDSRILANEKDKARLALRNFSMETAFESPTDLKVYPTTGTGTDVNIARHYKRDVFNTFCADNPDIVAVIPIISKPDNFQRRTALRNTLGVACVPFKCRIFFIIGTSLKSDINKRLQTEYEQKRDILMIPKLDTYKDLNNKIVWMLNWIWNYCQEPKYVIRMIDDIHLNLQNLFPQLEAIQSDRYMFGHIVDYEPIRDKSSKYYISEEEWPFVNFPRYLLGTVVAFPTHLIPELRRNILLAPYCWVEDVWFGGVVPFMTNIPLLQTKFEHKCGKVSLESVNDYLYVHRVSMSNLYSYYKASGMFKETKTKTRVLYNPI